MQSLTPELDARYKALAEHCRAVLIASGRSPRFAASHGDMAAAYLMRHFTDDAMAQRAALPLFLRPQAG